MTSNEKENCKKTVAVVYGTRPEAIKVAPVIRHLDNHEQLRPVLISTAQHREMLDQVNEVFGITPDFDLNIFSHGQSLNGLAAKVIAGIDPILTEVKPDAILVQGDTTSVLSAGLAAANRQIPVVHLEAGLRSHKFHSPFPEEINRRVVSRISSLHLAPTPQSKLNLVSEGISTDDIVVAGNTVIDSLLFTIEKPERRMSPELETVLNSERRILLVTTHRRENWGESLNQIGRALRRISNSYPDDMIVLPAHRNPVVRKVLFSHLSGLRNVLICEPLPYGDFCRLLSASHLVLTDSGGVQEEAPTLGKPVLVLRENTERPEAVKAGTVKLIGTDEERIFEEVATMKSDLDQYEMMARAINPYGDGLASQRSTAAIAEMLGVGERLPDFEPKTC